MVGAEGTRVGVGGSRAPILGYGCAQCRSGLVCRVGHDPMVTSLPEVSVRPKGKGNGVSKVMIQPSNRSSGRNLSGMIVGGSRMRA